MQGVSVPACRCWVANSQALAKGGAAVASSSAPRTNSTCAGCIDVVTGGATTASTIAGAVVMLELLNCLMLGLFNC